MLRALQLATLGRGHVSPNPLVGCVIENQGRIIGEGWHQRYGEAHAERNAILSVRTEDEHLLPESTAYVTLEPCSHYGKQPPCADLLIERKIGRVVCCNDDPFLLVAGRGFAKLRSAGIPVEVGLLAEQGRTMNRRFFTFVEQKRPYIILKWAETNDGFIAKAGGKPVQISGPLSQRLVHKWRSEEDAIMVGTNTARTDNPRLNVRLWPSVDSPGVDSPSVDSPGVDSPGKNPTRIVIDRNLSLPPDLHLFDGSQPTIVFHRIDNKPIPERPNVIYSITQSLDHSIQDLHQRQIQSVLVEGGTALLQSFLDAGLWDEMRVFRSPMMLGSGIKAPTVRGTTISREMSGADELTIYRP